MAFSAPMMTCGASNTMPFTPEYARRIVFDSTPWPPTSTTVPKATRSYASATAGATLDE
jgi:hypothetical protein